MPGTFNGRVAYASVRFTGPGAPEFRMQSGDFASVAMSGSLVRLTFQDEMAPAESCAQLSVRESLGGYARVGTWTNAYIEIQPLDTANAAAELDFDLVVLQEATGVPIPAFVPPPPPPPGPSLVGLQAWWRADDIALANGAPVVTWIDRTANGNDLTVPAGGVSPTYITSDPLFNGQAAVNFTILSGFRKALPVGFGSGSAALAAYMVLKFDPDPSLGFNTIFIMGWGDPTIPESLAFRADVPGQPWGTQTNSTSWFANPIYGTTLVAAFRNAAGAGWNSSSFEINNVVSGPLFPVGGAPVNVSTPVAEVTIGGRFANFGNYIFSGQIAEVLYYDTEQTPAERAATYSYLQTRYAIP
jgi:hypothetical protein